MLDCITTDTSVVWAWAICSI